MKQAEPDGTVHPDKLLDLWMGEPESGGEQPPSHPRLSRGMVIALSLTATVAFILLLKYAVDLLFIVITLLAVGLLLHFLGVATSLILSPGWLLILVFAIAFMASATRSQTDAVAALRRQAPRSLVAAVRWAQSYGWAQTPLIGSIEEDETAAAAGTGTSRPSPPIRSALSIAASNPTIILGHPLTLTARLSGASPTSVSARVRFYAEDTLLGTAELRKEGEGAIARLTMNGLTAGLHEIRAELVGASDAGRAVSEPVKVTVHRR